MALYCGIDLHSTNNYVGLYDEQDREVLCRKLPNELGVVLQTLETYRPDISGIVVESTFNWYWLVDGLVDHGYRVWLSNPAGNEQYSGLKYSDDKSDCRWLAQMQRLGVIKKAYIYPREERPIRDLLRKRMKLVQQRTANMLSVQNIIGRNTGRHLKFSKIAAMTDEEIDGLLESGMIAMAPRASIEVIKALDEQISAIEKKVLAQARQRKEFELLKTVYGVGSILAQTIMYETGQISRFESVGDYCSYARCVGSRRMSNGKKKGENNTKNGNRYLAWAFVEAANFACRFYPLAQRFVQRKSQRRNYTLAVKALGHKLARACYYVMRDQVEFSPSRLFG